MVRLRPTMAAAGLARARWREGGAPLGRHPRLLRGTGPRDIVVDVQGNALGGVRLPEIEAPTATFATTTSPARGNRWPLADEVLCRLYPPDQDHLNRARAHVERALLGGTIRHYRRVE